MVISDDEEEMGEELYGNLNITHQPIEVNPLIVSSSEVLAALISKLASQTRNPPTIGSYIPAHPSSS